MGARFLQTQADSRRPEVVRFGNLTMWAERGLIHIVDERTGERKVVSRRTALHRLKSLSDMLRNSRREAHSHDQHDAKRIQEIRTMVDDMIAACQSAERQGEPFNPEAVAEMRRRQPKTIVVPNVASMYATL